MLKSFSDKLFTSVGQKLQRANENNDENILLALGRLLSNQQWSIQSTDINDFEFKIFSQFGDDGIIQYLIKHIDTQNKTFIEFGVEDYSESNTRFLMMNNNWKGFVMDGSEEAMERLSKQNWYWKYSLTNKAVFIHKDNINPLLKETNFRNIGLLHIDIDGNDYHILESLDFTTLNPSILIVEYNSVFGNERKISIPYSKDFVRTRAHYSNLYFGASLPALNFLANKKGYRLIGCNLQGNNAYFVRQDLINEKVCEQSLKAAFKESTFREGRNKDYSLSLIGGNDRLEIIKGLQVVNIETNEVELL